MTVAQNEAKKDDDEPGGESCKNGPKKRRIALLTFFYKPAGGGVPRYIETLSKKLAESGHGVDVITASYNGKKIERDGNITVYRLPCMDILRENRDDELQASDFLKFLRKYSKQCPDIFVAQNFHAATRAAGHSLALNIVSLEKKIPLALTVHAFIGDDEDTAMKISLVKNLYWDRVIGVGSYLAESLFEQGISSDKINVVHPPVDIKQFRPGLSGKWLRSRINVSDKNFVILHASRLDSKQVATEKGVFTLVKALASIKDNNVKLLISSAPTVPALEESKAEIKKNIMETAKLMGVEKRVIIETFNPEDMYHVYNGCDLFAMASQTESFGLVYAEAMACGLPVIGTSVGGVPEIIENGKSGVLVGPDNHVELSKSINNIIKNYKKMGKMGNVGRKFVVDNLNSDKICKKLMGIYESIISRYSSGETSDLPELSTEKFPELEAFQKKSSCEQLSLDESC